MDEGVRTRLVAAVAAGIQLGAVACGRQTGQVAQAGDASIVALDPSALGADASASDAGDATDASDATDAETGGASDAATAVDASRAASNAESIREAMLQAFSSSGGVNEMICGARASCGGGIVLPNRNNCGGLVTGIGQPPATKPPPPPRGDVAVGGVSFGAGPVVPNADRVMHGLRGKLRFCYQQALAQDPEQSGKLVCTVAVAPNGDVISSSISANSGLSTSADCCARALRSAQFDAPGAPATITVPLVFTRGSKK